MIDYLLRKTKITGVHYAGLIKKQRNVIMEKRLGMLTKGVVLLHDSAPVHKVLTAPAAIPAWPPTLQPRPGHLRGRRSEDDEELTETT